MEKNYLGSAAIWFSLFVAVFVVIVARRPDILYNAQPWAEDGRIWLSSIYNNGFLSSLLHPQNGYYQTISRIAYGIGLLFGVEKAPLAANVIAISIRCFFVMFIVSSRLSCIKRRYRIAAVIYFLLMPNISEGYVNITNAHWYLSMYLMAVVLADEASTKAWKIHDMLVLLISSLSGPFVIFIVPGLLIKRIIQRGGFIAAVKGINSFDTIMALCCVIQVTAILLTPNERLETPLGASFKLLSAIIATRIFCGSFFSNEQIFYSKIHIFHYFFFIPITTLLIYNIIKEDYRFKIAALFPILMISFALAKPIVTPEADQWPVMAISDGGGRYFFVTNFYFFCFILFLINKTKNISTCLLSLLMVILIPLFISYFVIPPLPDAGYRQGVIAFNKLEKGEEMDIQIVPLGWSMHLKKK